MTAALPPSPGKRALLLTVGGLGLLVTLAMASFNSWCVWRGFQAYALASGSPSIPAEILSTRSQKLTVFGDLRFRLDGGASAVDYRTEVRLSSQSEYRAFRPGTRIAIIPRDGCDDPVVVKNAKIPILEMLLLACYLGAGYATYRGMKAALRPGSA